jgi:hypothetical protein
VATSITQRHILSLGRSIRAQIPASSTLLLSVPIIGRNRLVVIRPYISVVNQAVNITLSAAWTDPDYGPDSYTWLNNQNLSPATYPIVAISVLGEVGSSINITAFASTANIARLSISVEAV